MACPSSKPWTDRLALRLHHLPVRLDKIAAQVVAVAENASAAVVAVDSTVIVAQVAVDLRDLLAVNLDSVASPRSVSLRSMIN